MDEWAASNEETNQIFQLEKIMDEWKGTESGDKENKQKQQMGMTEEESTEDFHLLLQNQIYCWNLMFLFYSFIMEPAGLLDCAAAIKGERTHDDYIYLYLLTSVCKYRSMCR